MTPAPKAPDPNPEPKPAAWIIRTNGYGNALFEHNPNHKDAIPLYEKEKK